MKKIILIFSAIYFAMSAFAQTPEKINFQGVIRDASNNLLTNQLIGYEFTVMMGSPTGTIVYQEFSTTTTNNFGLINVVIGEGNVASGSTSDIMWSDGPYFLKTAIDFAGGTNYNDMGVSKLLNVPYSLRTLRAGFSESVDYNKLSNKPSLIITTQQAAKLGLITITNSANVDTIRRDIDTNLTKVSFPGIGTTAGTAYEMIWTEKNDSSVYYPSGNVGFGIDSSATFNGSALHVGGGILQRGIPSDSVEGLMYYDSASNVNYGPGTYYYYDDIVQKQTFNVEAAFYYQAYFIDSTQTVPDIVENNDMIIQANLGIGSNIDIGYTFNENNIAIVDSIIELYFDDTSSSSSFPSSDWKIKFNDQNSGGQSYFAIEDVHAGRVPFKLMAETPESSFFVNANGELGLGTNNPTTKLDMISGTVTATALVGNASGLTGIPAGTGTTQNAGSVTLEADNDNDNTGEIIFETKNTPRVVIANNGNLGIGNSSPSNKLDVNGTATITNLKVNEKLIVSGTLSNAIFSDPTSGTVTLNYDVAGKNTIIFNSAGGILTIDGFQNGVVGQKVTLINLSSSNTINFNRFISSSPQQIRFPSYPNFTPLSLPQYGTVTFVFDGYYWNCTDQVM